MHRVVTDERCSCCQGKTLKGYEHARKQIVAGVLKDYVALVHGTFNTERGECCAPVDSSTFAETMCVKVGEACGCVYAACGMSSHTMMTCVTKRPVPNWDSVDNHEKPV